MRCWLFEIGVVFYYKTNNVHYALTKATANDPQNGEVRQLASYCFAALLRLMPLEVCSAGGGAFWKYITTPCTHGLHARGWRLPHVILFTGPA
jgi:hypothetical protein